MNVLSTKLHSLYIYALNKIGLCAFNNKRYILTNDKGTIAHDHNSIKIKTYIISPITSNRIK